MSLSHSLKKKPPPKNVIENGKKEAQTLSPTQLFHSHVPHEHEHLSAEPKNPWNRQREAFICNTDEVFLSVKEPCS